MANPYRELFAAPGTWGFAVAGMLARMALPMTGIGIITMLAQLRGSYALAGAVSATFVLSYALLSPQSSRLVDRHGQGRVLPAATAIRRGSRAIRPSRVMPRLSLAVPVRLQAAPVGAERCAA